MTTALQGVEDTLFIPLEARIFASKKYSSYFYDEKALSLEKYIPHNSIQKKSSEYTMMASVARSYNMDEMTRAFAAGHGICNVVCLGAGLETTYFRLREKEAHFYEIDLPRVIQSRRIVLGEHPLDTLIEGNLFDVSWVSHLNPSLPTLLLASGVFQYFTEEVIQKFIQDVKPLFTESYLIFDATNKTGLRYANNYVKKTGNTDALMQFYVDDSAAFSQKMGVTLLEERPFFTAARKILGQRLNPYTRIAMKVVDDTKRAILVYVKVT